MITDSEYYASLLRKMKKPMNWHPETVDEKARFLDCISKKEPMLFMALFLIGMMQADMFKSCVQSYGWKIPPPGKGVTELWDMMLEPGVLPRLKELLKERGMDVG